MQAQGMPEDAGRCGEALDDQAIIAQLERIKEHAKLQVGRERGCAYGAVELGLELQWVKDQNAYSKIKCATFHDWLEAHMPIGRSQAAVYTSVAPLPLHLVRGRKLSLGRLQIIVKAPPWQWPVLCQYGHLPTAEARLSAAVRAGEEHLLVHQEQELALAHVGAVLQGAEPFRLNKKKVALDEAGEALVAALKQVSSAARELGQLKDLAGANAKACPWLPRLIKAAATADGEVHAVLGRFRIPDPQAKSAEDKDFGGKTGGPSETPAPAAPPRSAPGSAAAAPGAPPAPPAAAPPTAAPAPWPSAEPPPAAEPSTTEPSTTEPSTTEPSQSSTTDVQITDICAGLGRVLSASEQQRLSNALLHLLIDQNPPNMLAAARSEVSALCEVARSAEGPGGLPATTMAHLSAALQQEPIEQRWPMTFNVLMDEALVAARPDLDLIDPDRVPASCRELLLAALAREREQAPAPHLSDEERDAALCRLSARVAEQRAQILHARKQRRY